MFLGESRWWPEMPVDVQTYDCAIQFVEEVAPAARFAGTMRGGYQLTWLWD
jgi:hypothetical protein